MSHRGSHQDYGGLNALVVDESRFMRAIVRTILMQLGVGGVAEAEDGASAIATLREFKADIVFTGNRMSPVDGIELTRLIRLGRAGIDWRTPVIMVSAYTDAANVLAARDAGITEFLAKPVSAMLIGKRLEAAIDHPRPFVRAPHFLGPERRRRRLGVTPDRRHVPFAYAAERERRTERRGEATLNA